MTSVQPADPREPATNLRALTALMTAGLVLTNTAFLYTPSRTVLGLIVLVTLGSLVAYWIVRSVWFRRCWTNAELIAPGHQRLGRGWAAGIWFVPVANLWLPRRILLDIRRASGLAGERLVNLWWGAGVVMFLCGTTAVLGDPPRAAVLAACAVLPLRAVAFIRIIGQVTTRQVEALGLPPLSKLGTPVVERAEPTNSPAL
ncbi:DUF4328 domain-containing protein [Kitasatospora sp. NPDC003701]